jgi:polyhydroxyalkanoate synthesis regulator phasin
MADPDDFILPLLREMRAEINGRFDAMGETSASRHALVIARLDKLEEQQRSFRHALTADTLMSKLLTGEFEERIEALEQKVRELESQK